MKNEIPTTRKSPDEAADAVFAKIESILIALVTRLGPFGVAALPAAFTGYSVFASLVDKTGVWMSLVFAVIVILGIETAGILLGHNAVRLNNLAGWLLAAFYLGAVVGIVGVGHTEFSPLALGIGIFSPFLVLSVYVSHAMMLSKNQAEIREETEEERQRLRQEEQEERERLRREEQEDAEKELQLELKRLREEAKIVSRYGVIGTSDAQQVAQQSAQQGAHWQYPIDQARAQRAAQLRDDSAQRRAEIMQLLDDGVLKVSHIADRLGVHRNTITSDLKSLQEQDLVYKNGHWRRVNR